MSENKFSGGYPDRMEMSPLMEEHDAFDEDIDDYDYQIDNLFDGIEDAEEDLEMEDYLDADESEDSFNADPYSDNTDDQVDEISDYDDLED